MFNSTMEFSVDYTMSAPRLIFDETEGIVYVAENTGEVLQVDGNSLKPTSLKVSNELGAYLSRWKWLMLGLSSAWILHCLIVTAGTSWLAQGTTTVGSEEAAPTPEVAKRRSVWNRTPATYEFGNQRVTLASPLSRGLAFSADLVLFVIAITASFWIHARLLGLKTNSPSQREQVNLLMILENSLMYDSWQDIQMLADSVIEVVSLLAFRIPDESWTVCLMVLIIVAIDTGMTLWALKIFDEGRYGATPGKRLMGIRSVRTTLRNSGFARVLARDILYWFDLLGLITPLPAAASMIYSFNRQRWGDRIADTIVINRVSTENMKIESD